MEYLPNHEDVATALFPQIIDPLVRETLTEMLYRIKSESFKSQLLRDPHSPILYVFLDIWMSVIDVCKHHVIRITTLIVDTFTPSFVVTYDLVDSLLFVGLIIVRSAEVF